MKSRLSNDYWLFRRPSAHRGLHDQTIPENSLLAFEKACERGFPIELDVQFTLDKKLVVFHDDNPKRMTGADCDIRDVDYKTVKSWKLANTDQIVPDFSETLKLVNGRVPLLIEIKTQKQSGIAAAVLNELKDYHGDFAIQSFDPRIMLDIKRLNPSVIRGQLGSSDKSNLGFKTDFALKWLPLNFLVKPDFVNYNIKNLPISKAVSNGLPLICWTVRSQEDKQKALNLCKSYVFENILP